MTNSAMQVKARNRAPLGASYWKLWTSSGLSNLADGVFKIALPLLAIQLTQSPTLIAGLSVAATLPWLVFALTAGALADRLDRRKIMLWANVSRGILPAMLAAVILLDFGSIWALYVVALMVGVAETLYDTSAQSIMPQVVDRDQLSRANGRLYAVELTANQFVGPPLGGLLVAIGVVAGLAVPAALWLAAVGGLLLVPGAFRMEREQTTTLRFDIGEGLRFLWNQKILRTLAVMTGVFNFASSAAFAVLVLFAVGPASDMKLSDVGFGLLLTTSALGAFAGSFISEWAEARLGRSKSLTLAVLGVALFVGAPAMTDNPYILGPIFFVGGILTVLWNVITVSLRQRITPNRLLGRVNSVYRLLAWGTMPLGAAAGGVLAQWLGLQVMFGIMGGLALALLVMMPILTDKAIAAADVES
ncbi:MFS transporter [Arthrobacter oryzae]|uniref:Na+/melibiose symporter-like transporter n=1 Tax=Arthrobacter oryzae TaxID=409290 RepID=A0A495FNR0_9MICC|nr:MFS transporter [Arthrobacter oryzae]RKR30169.1 Na+/melibiose symporter-like transporter [Arthrobacter oryzae]